MSISLVTLFLHLLLERSAEIILRIKISDSNVKLYDELTGF